MNTTEPNTESSDEQSTYEQVKSFIESMNDHPVEFKQIVVPEEDWHGEIKERAEELTDEPGPSYTAIDGVTITYIDYLDAPEARLELTDDGGDA
jgi:hypothetical protein